MKLRQLLLLTTTLLSTALSLPDPSSRDLFINPSPTPNLSIRTPPADPPSTKYFHEPGDGDHYDARYYRGFAVSYEEKQDTLRNLVRSYFTIFRDHNIETWLAHGTLLGWWWNGKIMPWDWDLDTQVSAATLTWMGEHLNMTFHNYTLPSSEGKGYREYLLDVNPYIVERQRGDGNNVIDARWIDTKTGLYIDITGLAETEPTASPGVWNCKNWHRYQTREIWPLRETVFEGMPALVPYAFDDILTTEYTSTALTNTIHEGHQWDATQKVWLQINTDKIPGDSKRKREIATREAKANAKPHVPRSLQDDEDAKPGLSDLLHVL